MNVMNFGSYQQISFDPLDDQYQGSHEMALKARNAKMRELRKAGYACKGWTLTGQLRKYAGWGCPDGSVRNVYKIEARNPQS